MLVPVISDIHGNHLALDAIEKDLRGVLRDYKREHFDRIWLLGDLIDPLPRSAEVIQRIRGWCPRLVMREPELVAGNHEAYACGLVPLDGAVNPLFRSTIPVTIRQLRAAEQYDWLCDQCTDRRKDSGGRLYTRRLLSGDDLGYRSAAVWLCHGMLRDYMEWSYHLAEGIEGAHHARMDMDYARGQLGRRRPRRCLILCGHSHRAFVWHRGRRESEPRPVNADPGDWVDIGEGDYLACVGSAGVDHRAGRDERYRLEYTLLDIRDRRGFSLQVRRIELDREMLRQELARAYRDIGDLDPPTQLRVLRYFGLTDG